MRKKLRSRVRRTLESDARPVPPFSMARVEPTPLGETLGDFIHWPGMTLHSPSRRRTAHATPAHLSQDRAVHGERDPGYVDRGQSPRRREPAQGMPDFPAPPEIKAAACRAIEANINQYAITWGARGLREAVAEHAEWYLGLRVDPETEITVTCGCTEAMLVALLSLINPGDEVILTQPFYENYWPDFALAGATPRFVPLRPPHWRFDPDELASAFNDKTKAIILCNPNNPTGTVFTRADLEAVAASVSNGT